MVRGSATPVDKKMFIPGLIFFKTASGETTEDSQFDPDSFIWGMFSEYRREKIDETRNEKGKQVGCKKLKR